MRFRSHLGVLALIGALLFPVAVPSVSFASALPAHDPRFFAETGYRVANDAFWDYFTHRGGVLTFGYPVSRQFTLLGFPTQVFQRAVMQQQPDGSVRPMNLLDPGLLAYDRIDGATFPAADPSLAAVAPRADQPDYGDRMLEFLRATVPDTWNDQAVNFFTTFSSTVTCAVAFSPGRCQKSLLPLLNLEIWGAPTSAPQYDPANHGFVYQRFERAIMLYDAGCDCTQGVLLGDSFKALLTGERLPDDLAAEAAGSPFLRQYAPGRPGSLARSDDLPGSDLTDAFVPEAGAGSP